jgi:hypothetical protein
MPAAFVRIANALRRGTPADMLRESNTVLHARSSSPTACLRTAAGTQARSGPARGDPVCARCSCRERFFRRVQDAGRFRYAGCLMLPTFGKELAERCVVGCLNDCRQALGELLVRRSPSGLFGSKVDNHWLHQPRCRITNKDRTGCIAAPETTDAVDLWTVGFADSHLCAARNPVDGPWKTLRVSHRPPTGRWLTTSSTAYPQRSYIFMIREDTRIDRAKPRSDPFVGRARGEWLARIKLTAPQDEETRIQCWPTQWRRFSMPADFQPVPGSECVFRPGTCRLPGRVLWTVVRAGAHRRRFRPGCCGSARPSAPLAPHCG